MDEKTLRCIYSARGDTNGGDKSEVTITSTPRQVRDARQVMMLDRSDMHSERFHTDSPGVQFEKPMICI